MIRTTDTSPKTYFKDILLLGLEWKTTHVNRVSSLAHVLAAWGSIPTSIIHHAWVPPPHSSTSATSIAIATTIVVIKVILKET